MKIVGKWERRIGYSFAAVVDIAQIILDFFAIGAVVNRFIDIAMGALILIYGALRGLWTINKFLIFLAYFAGEMIPFVDALPFWTLDILNLYGGTVRTKEEVVTEPVEGITAPRGGRLPPANQDGIRAPRNAIPPVIKAPPLPPIIKKPPLIP